MVYLNYTKNVKCDYRFPDCLARPDEYDFTENFCDGPRGFRANTFDEQCQNYYNYGAGYTECYGTVRKDQRPISMSIEGY